MDLVQGIYPLVMILTTFVDVRDMIILDVLCRFDAVIGWKEVTVHESIGKYG